MSRLRLTPLFMLLVSFPAAAATRNVGPGQTYATIDAAVAAATTGDTIQIAAGSYTLAGTLAISVDLTFVGPAAASVNGPSTLFAVSGGALVRIEGLSLRPDAGHAVTVSGGADVTLVDLDVRSAGTTGSPVGGQGVNVGGVGSVAHVQGGLWKGLVVHTGAGSAMLAHDSGTLEVSDATFQDNIGSYVGAIDAKTSSSLVVSGCVFERNESLSTGGGAIVYDSGGPNPVVIENSTFTGNIAHDGGGGAVSIGRAASVRISGNTFSGNQTLGTGNSGGGLALYNSEATSYVVEDNLFLDNTASGDGGGLLLSLLTGAVVELRSNKFCSNHAGTGGGLSVADVTQLLAENNSFTENHASFSGGGISCDKGSISSVLATIRNSDLLGNDAPSNGEQVMNVGCTLSLRNSLIQGARGTQAVVGSGTTMDYDAFYDNSGGDLGAGLTAAVHRVSSDPQLVTWSRNANCDDDDLRLRSTSPLRDVGDPTLLDPDGTRSDIGVYGGPLAPADLFNDDDHDLVLNAYDCAPDDASVYPGAPETCDGADEDCDGRIDLPVPAGAPTWYRDYDRDTFGDPASSVVVCNMPAGFVADDRDCDDGDAAVNPAASEICDGLDNDCDTLIDDADSATELPQWWDDGDGDGFGRPGNSRGACTQPAGRVDNDGDCDDGDANRNPMMVEFCDGVDQNCNGLIDDEAINPTTFYLDHDGDGHGSSISGSVTVCDAPAGYVESDDDCDDGNVLAFPRSTAETCASPTADLNCDGRSGLTDGDGDGVVACEDCDDVNASTYPGAPDTPYDGVIHDCDRVSDFDADLDGHDATTYGGDDCDDTKPDVFPGATEIADDGIDQDCSGKDKVTLPGLPDVIKPTVVLCGGCSSAPGAPGLFAAILTLGWVRRRRSSGARR